MAFVVRDKITGLFYGNNSYICTYMDNFFHKHKHGRILVDNINQADIFKSMSSILSSMGKNVKNLKWTKDVNVMENKEPYYHKVLPEDVEVI